MLSTQWKKSIFHPELVIALSLLSTSLSANSGDYVYTDFGLSGYSVTSAKVNISGEVAARFLYQHMGYNYSQAAAWDGRSWRFLGDPGMHRGAADGVNDADLIVGTVKGPQGDLSDDGRAMIWNGSAGFQLGLLPNATSTQALGVNNLGQVVGLTKFSNTNGYLATLWTGGVPSTLPTLGGIACSASDINALGQIVGSCDRVGDQVLHATLWEGGVATMLSAGSSEAVGINDAGQVAGHSLSSGYRRATVWTYASPTVLGMLPGLTTSRAYAINNSGQVVGMTDDSPFGRATLWNGTTPTDLNIYLDAASVSAGWRLQAATDINSKGWIVGVARNLNTYEARGFLLSLPEPEPEMCMDDQAGYKVGHPIIPGTGEKVLTQEDHRDFGIHPIEFIRYFRSYLPKGQAQVAAMGKTWSHNHAVSLLQLGATNGAAKTVSILFGNGRKQNFFWDSSISEWKTNGSPDTLTPGTEGFIYRRSDDDSTWIFDAAGRLISTTARNGWVAAYSYSTASTPVEIAASAGLLIGVTNHFGRTLSFTYNSANQLSSVVGPDGSIYSYQYDGLGADARLTAVTYPQGTGPVSTRAYVYENTSFPQFLTGVIDERGNRLATYAYDSQGRGISTEYAGGVDRYSITYGASPSSWLQITDPLGTQRNYLYGSVKNKLVVTGANLPTASGEKQAANRTQNAAGLVSTETDYLGVQTTYTWDSGRRLPLSVTRAANRPLAKTESIQWHSTFRLPALVTQPGRTIAYTYDAIGNKLTETETDTSSGTSRTWTWTYNAHSLVTSSVDPNNHQTSYTYYSDTSFDGIGPDSTGHREGDLQSLTDPLNMVTTFNSYDRAGRVRQKTDAKGIVSDFEYTPRGWLKKVTETPPGMSPRITSYTYDSAGLLTSVINPDGSVVNYVYDSAQRLIEINDSRGNTINYGLDAMGNRVIEQVKDSSGTLQRSITRSFDALSRLQQVSGASQ